VDRPPGAASRDRERAGRGGGVGVMSDASLTTLEERLRSVPATPGVYLWKDATGTVLYVGKSKALRDRMRSYLQSPRGQSAKTRRLVRAIADFDVILTQTELEALLLEMTLIKQHRPRYNVLLKDDKSYPYIKATLNEPWPRIFATRRHVADGARYFGPYASPGAVYRTLDQLNRFFAFRPPGRCADDKFARHRALGRPCLYYDIRRCLGPCVPSLVDQEEYRAAIAGACRFLEGRTEHVVRDLRQRMQQAAERLEFERAAYLRDRIQDIERVSEAQRVLRTVDTDQDVIALAREADSAVVQVFYIRGGKLIGAEPFSLQNTEDAADAQVLSSFVTQFYESAAEVPPHVLLAEHVEEPLIIEQWLSQRRGQRVEIRVPRRGEKRQLVEMATQNARRKLDELRAQWLNTEQRAVAALAELREVLGLAELPLTIECFDISTTQGSHAVGAMVVFEHGVARPARYRKFRITTVAGMDDVACMREVLSRRLRRAVAHGDEVPAVADAMADAAAPPDDPPPAAPAAPWSVLPDLLLVDGGIGQLNAAIAVTRELGLAHVPIAGVVKGPDRDRFDLLLPGASAPLVLRRDGPALALVQRIDEEADRFARTYHQTLRGKAALRSTLEAIPGIGPTRRRALQRHFGSLEAMRSASVEELAAVPGMNRPSAEALKQVL
jgi:excinuclease ABC subunit C